MNKEYVYYLPQIDKIDFKLPEDIVYHWDLKDNLYYVGYKTIEAGWYDVGNAKYIFKLSEQQPISFLSTNYGPEPVTFLEKKEK
jgi:hypothetical protein